MLPAQRLRRPHRMNGSPSPLAHRAPSSLLFSSPACVCARLPGPALQEWTDRSWPSWLDGVRCLDKPGSWHRAAPQPVASLRRRCVCGCRARLFPQSSGLLASWCSVRRQQCGKHTQAARLKAILRQTPVCSHCGFAGLWRANRSLGAWPVHLDGHWALALPSVEKEKIWYQMHIDSHIWHVLRAH